MRVFPYLKSGARRSIRIFEASARDGLQNEAKSVSVEMKVELINRLIESGCKDIEAGAFVHPRWVPQMAGTAEVLKRLPKKTGVTYPCLTPNEKALETYHSSGSDQYCDEVAIFLAATEGFNKANLNRTVAESLRICQAVADKAKASGVRFRGYVSTVIGCPFDGAVEPKQVTSLAKALLDMGCYEVSLGDTIGVGVPATWEELLNDVTRRIPVEKLGAHCHDTYGSGVANVLRAVEMGVPSVDTSVGGLGGCPYAPGASGNVATEDVVYALHKHGYETGIDLFKAAETGQWISDQLGRKNSSRAGPAILADQRRRAQSIST